MKWFDIPGWFDFDWVYDEVVQNAPAGSKIVEVGCWLGRSLAYLAEQAQLFDRGLKVIGVDHGVGSAEHAAAVAVMGGSTIPTLMRNLADCGLTVPLLAIHSAAAARLFDDESVAFVFLDGGHTEEEVAADIAAWWPKVAAGGTMAGHDYNARDWPGVVTAVDATFFGATNDRGCWFAKKGEAMAALQLEDDVRAGYTGRDERLKKDTMDFVESSGRPIATVPVMILGRGGVVHPNLSAGDVGQLNAFLRRKLEEEQPDGAV